VPSIYSVQLSNGAWSLTLDGTLQAQYPTLQEAIDTAKSKAAREGRCVLWRDRFGGTYGPIKPSALGWYSPESVAERMGVTTMRLKSRNAGGA